MKRLDGFVFSESEAIVLFGRGAIDLFGLLPTFACLDVCKWSLAALRTMMVKAVEFDRELSRTQWHGHINLLRPPGPFI
jgi:hypothetical protein